MQNAEQSEEGFIQSFDQRLLHLLQAGINHLPNVGRDAAFVLGDGSAVNLLGLRYQVRGALHQGRRLVDDPQDTHCQDDQHGQHYQKEEQRCGRHPRRTGPTPSQRRPALRGVYQWQQQVGHRAAEQEGQQHGQQLPDYEQRDHGDGERGQQPEPARRHGR